eukprot:15689259-Heterocapsa_arctica.AAC.1
MEERGLDVSKRHDPVAPAALWCAINAMSTRVPTLVAVAAKVSKPSLKCLIWRAITRAFTF